MQARPLFAPWDRPEAPSAFTAHQTAVRLGHLRWVERTLFEVLGGWVTTVPEADVKLRLGAQSHHHAWHADLCLEHMPDLRDPTVDQATVPAEGMEAFFAAVAEPDAPDQTIEKLVGVYRVVLPHLIAACTYHLDHCSTVTDAPVIRALGHLIDDDLADWRDGELLLQSLIRTDDEIDRATAHQAALTRAMVAAGGVVGPGSVGPAPAPLGGD